jgi:hypothetical protein
MEQSGAEVCICQIQYHITVLTKKKKKKLFFLSQTRASGLLKLNPLRMDVRAATDLCFPYHYSLDTFDLSNLIRHHIRCFMHVIRHRFFLQQK